jgi:pyridoxine 5-phosphate synthase
MILLGVNIDHVATLRQARKGVEPEPVQAALLAEQSGADQITVHLREDRRHIQDKDVFLLRKLVQTKLNLEMAATEEMIKIALEILPDTVTLVPEKREELTTEGGLKLTDDHKNGILKLKEANIEVSVFIEPDLKMVEKAKELGADTIEFHTGKYANTQGKKEIEEEVNRLYQAARKAKELGLRVVAGHGLNYHNVQKLVELDIFEEYNIGHSIISRAVFTGLAEAVMEMKTIINS